MRIQSTNLLALYFIMRSVGERIGAKASRRNRADVDPSHDDDIPSGDRFDDGRNDDDRSDDNCCRVSTDDRPDDDGDNAAGNDDDGSLVRVFNGRNNRRNGDFASIARSRTHHNPTRDAMRFCRDQGIWLDDASFKIAQQFGCPFCECELEDHDVAGRALNAA